MSAAGAHDSAALARFLGADREAELLTAGDLPLLELLPDDLGRLDLLEQRDVALAPVLGALALERALRDLLGPAAAQLDLAALGHLGDREPEQEELPLPQAPRGAHGGPDPLRPRRRRRGDQHGVRLTGFVARGIGRRDR